LLALLFGASSAADAATLRVTSPDYTLTLDGDWAEVRTADQEQRNFRSKLTDASLVVSSMSISAPPSGIERIARRMAGIRVEAENKAAAEVGRKVQTAQPVLTQQPWGYTIAYSGSDSGGRRFSFYGAVTAKQILSIYVESKIQTEKGLKAVLDQV